MQERVEQLDGTLRITSSRRNEADGQTTGTTVEATVPLTHLLPPDPKSGTDPKSGPTSGAASKIKPAP